MRTGLLLRLLIGLAMALSPLALPAGAAMAGAPAHHGATASADHCDGPAQPETPGKAADTGCCAAGCMAAALPNAAPEPAIPADSGYRRAADQFRRGFLGEIATPPPRRG